MSSSTQALDAIAAFVDLKSPYFLGHSQAVAELVAEAGATLGLAGDGSANAAPGRSGARLRPARDLELDLGQARPARRRRTGTRPVAPVPQRADAAAVAGAGAARRASPRSSASASTARGYPRGLAGGAIPIAGAHARRRRRLPGNARAAAPSTATARRGSGRRAAARSARPDGSTATPSTPCSKPPATGGPAPRSPGRTHRPRGRGAAARRARPVEQGDREHGS